MSIPGYMQYAVVADPTEDFPNGYIVALAMTSYDAEKTARVSDSLRVVRLDKYQKVEIPDA